MNKKKAERTLVLETINQQGDEESMMSQYNLRFRLDIFLNKLLFAESCEIKIFFCWISRATNIQNTGGKKGKKEGAGEILLFSNKHGKELRIFFFCPAN